MFTIYSIGDSAFLQQILNSVAMICGTGDFVKLVSIGLILGIIAVCIQSIISASKDFNLHHILLGWVMYACFFGPGVTVTIEDAYTGQVRVVDNVPIGVGFCGGLLSNVGYGMTKLFQQGFQGADATNNGLFAESLRELQTVRRSAGDAQVLEAINRAIDPTGTKKVDFEKSVSNYLKECTFVKVSLGMMTKEELYRKNLFEAMPFQSKIYGTQLYLGNGDEDLSPDCTKAWALLQNAFKKTEEAAVIQAVNRVLGVKEVGGTFPSNLSSVDSGLHLMNMTGLTAQDFVRTSIVEPIYSRAAHGFYNDMGDVAAATMISQAIAQRNTQWAAEQTLFMTTVRPLLTFFEGFILAITPVMGFLFVIGLFGIRLGLRYFQTLMWIQLWMPVIAICNLYITMAARGDMASYPDDFVSFYLLDRMDATMQTWIATGGLLCSMTPIISLFLVTGSTYAFTTLASRLGGGDHINEKTVAPDALKVDALHSQQAFSQGSSAAMLKTGWEGAFQTLQMGAMGNQVLQSAAQNLRSNQDSFMKAFTNGDSQVQQIAENAGFNKQLGDTLSNSKTKSVQSVYSEAYKIAKTFTENDAVAQELATHITKSIGASIGGGANEGATGGSSKSYTQSMGRSGDGTSKTLSNSIGKAINKVISGFIKGNASIQATYDTADKETIQKATQKMAQDLSDVGYREDFQAGLSQAYSNALQTDAGKRLTETIANTKGTTATEAAQSLVASQKSYQDAVSISKNMGAVSNISSKDFVSTVLGGGNGAQSYQAIQGLFMQMSGEERLQVQDRINALRPSGYAANGYSSEESIKAAAVMEVAQRNPSEYSDEVANIWRVGTGIQHDGNYQVEKQDIPQAQGATGSVDKNFKKVENFDAQKGAIEQSVDSGHMVPSRTKEASSKISDGFKGDAGEVSANADHKRQQGVGSVFSNGILRMNKQTVAIMNRNWSTHSFEQTLQYGSRNGWAKEVTDYMAMKHSMRPDQPGYLPGGSKIAEDMKAAEKNFDNYVRKLYEPELKSGAITSEQLEQGISAAKENLVQLSKVEPTRLEAYASDVNAFLTKTMYTNGSARNVFKREY